MKEANFIDYSWQSSLDMLHNGESVFLCAPEHYGKKFFLQYIRNSDLFIKRYSIVNINNIKDSESISFQDILNQFQLSLDETCLVANNQHDFIDAIESLVKSNSFLVLISNSFRSYKNVSLVIDALHEVILKHPNGYKKNIVVLLTDDYSLYYYEREISFNASRWFFFKRKYLKQLTKVSLIENCFLDFFHNQQLVQDIIYFSVNSSGGHQGLIREIISYFLSEWRLIDFNNVEIEIKSHLYRVKFIDSLRQELSYLTLEELTYLYSFKNKKLIEAHESDLMKRFHQKGVLIKTGDLYIELSNGVIRELLLKIIKSKTMVNQRKLILCIHGLDGDGGTWGKFKELFSKDSLLSDYDFEVYTFPTSKFWNFNFFKAEDPPINQLADGLKTVIDVKFRAYSEIVLVCHSLGGLVGRKYLLERYLEMKAKQNNSISGPEINKIIMYATPHNGSSIANVAKIITIRNRQIKQLCKSSDFIMELNDKWMKMGAHNYYKGWYIIGGKDQIVSKESAEMVWGNDRCKTVIDADHFNIIKPESENSLSYLIFRQTLLEDI